MEALPEDVTLMLLRGLGRYIRAAQPSDLPPSVRRFKGFREAALARHRDTVLSILEEDASRALILQWLDEDKPSLPRDVREVLRVAADRPEGWQETLAARGSEPVTKKAAGDRTAELEAALEREKAKTAKAREDLKAEREAAAAALAEERAARAKVERLSEERAEALEDANRRAERAEVDGTKEQQRFERELRRARRDATKAEERAVELEQALKAARSGDKPEASGSTRPRGRSASPRKESVRKPRSGPRRPLKIPKGLLADDPLTLETWLDRDDVHLLVDGYNVTKAESGFGDLSLESQRNRLVTELNGLALRKKSNVTIVFDGASISRPRTRRAAVRTVFTAEDEIADDVIVELLEELPPVPVVVATNDKELQERVRALGATVATSDQLLTLLR